MAKQRQSAVPAATATFAIQLAVKLRALLPVNSQVKTAPLEANSLMKAADWRPPLLGLPVKTNLLVWTVDSSSQRLRRAGWRPPLLGPQD